MTKTAREILDGVVIKVDTAQEGELLKPIIDQALKELEAIHQQEIAKAQVGELKSLQDCRNVVGETLVNTGTDVWIADRIAELSQAATDHQTQAV